MRKILGRFRANSTSTVNFLIHYGYLIRILRGLYYAKTLKEFKFKESIDTLKIIAMGMNELKFNWYFGLHTALRLNGLTHEFHPTIFIISDKIFRAKEISINNEPIKFTRIKERLLKFGIRKMVFYFPIRKNVLDFIYIFRYKTVPEERIRSFIEEYAKKIDRKKIADYAQLYPKSVKKVLKNAGLI